MLQHIGEDGDVEATPNLVGQPGAEVGLEELVDAIHHPVVLCDVDARDVMAQAASFVGERTVGTPDIEYTPGRRLAQPGEQRSVRASGCVLQLIRLGRERQLTGTEPELVKPVPGDIHDDVAGVGEPVDMTDLVAVVGRDRHLEDALLRLPELDDDLGVEVEPGRVPLKRDVGQGIDAIGAIAAVPLAEIETRQMILDGGENAVADELVDRHPSGTRRTFGQHPRPEHGVGVAGLERCDEILDHLRRVLPVAVQQDDDVESALNRPAVPMLLVAAVPEVDGMADHRQRDVAGGLIGNGLLKGVVGAGVVADEHMIHPSPERRWQPFEDCGQGAGSVVGDDQDAHTGVRQRARAHRRARYCRSSRRRR